MSGYFRMEADAWESLVELLPRPLSREHAAMDLRHYADKVRLHEGGKLPDHGELAERWGWYSSTGKLAEKRVRLLKADEDAWKDPYRREAEPSATPKGQAKGRQRAGEGQAKGRQGAAPEQSEADNTPAEGSPGAGEGQAEGGHRAGEGPRARSSHRTPTPVTDTDTEGTDGRRPPGSEPVLPLVEPEPRTRKPIPGWDEAVELHAKIPGCGALTGPTVGMGKDLAAILRACGPVETLHVLRWWKDCDEPDSRPVFLRERKLKLPTVRRHLAEYRALAAEWVPGAARASPSGTGRPSRPVDDWLAGARAAVTPPKPDRIRIDPEAANAKP